MCKPWFKLTHDIVNHPYFRDPVLFQFFVYLIDKATIFSDEQNTRGTVVVKLAAYAKEYGIDRNKVRKMLARLVEDGAIKVLTSDRREGVEIEVCNYEKYQGRPSKEPSKRPSDLPSETIEYQYQNSSDLPSDLPSKEPSKRPSLMHARNTNPRVLEEEKKERKEILSNESTKKAADAASHAPVSPPSPSLEEVQTHAAATGIHPEIAEAFFWYYESRGWIGANGNPIRSWQAALRLWRARESQYANRQTTQHETAHHAQQSPADRREAERLAREQATLGTINQLLDQARAKQLAACRSPNASNFLP